MPGGERDQECAVEKMRRLSYFTRPPITPNFAYLTVVYNNWTCIQPWDMYASTQHEGNGPWRESDQNTSPLINTLTHREYLNDSIPFAWR